MTDNVIIKGCGEVCGDNRFDLIEKYKKQLIDSTNIESSKDEMAVIDNVLFRCWQMEWLDRLEEYDRQKAEIVKLEKVEKYADKTIKAQAAEIERLQAENKKQKAILEEINDEINPLPFETDFDIAMKKAKYEAIKEFAERLKTEAFECDVSFGYGKECYQQAVAVIEIDNLVKEMTEDENENH